MGSSPGLIAAFHARILMTPRHPPRALRSLTTPIGPPLLHWSRTSRIHQTLRPNNASVPPKLCKSQPSVSRRGDRLPSFLCIRKGSLTRPARHHVERAVFLLYCSGDCHSPYFACPKVDRVNPIHFQNTRVCVSCVTNTGLSKSTHLRLDTAGKADLNTDDSWSGQGARP